MRRPRITIAHLLVWVALLGVGFAALRSPSQLWASALFSIALATFIVAILIAVYRRGESRAFWVGFTTCGGAYMILALGPWHESLISPHLVTTALLDMLYPQVIPPQADLPAAPTTRRLTSATPTSMSPTTLTRVRIRRTGGFGSRVSVSPPATTGPWAGWTEPVRDQGVGMVIGSVVLVSPEPYRRIGHTLFSLAIGLMGGVLTRRLASSGAEPGPGES